jgi:hypothetical protein
MPIKVEIYKKDGYRAWTGLLKEVLQIVALALIIALMIFMIRSVEKSNAEIYRLEADAAALSGEIDAAIAEMIARTGAPALAIEEPAAVAEEPAPLPYTEREIDMLARVVYAEARGCAPEEQALVVWAVLQRASGGAFHGTPQEVILRDGQFLYSEKHPVLSDIRELCLSEAEKWAAGEPAPTHPIYAPTLPYYYFNDNGKHNYFY